MAKAYVVTNPAGIVPPGLGHRKYECGEPIPAELVEPYLESNPVLKLYVHILPTAETEAEPEVELGGELEPESKPEGEPEGELAAPAPEPRSPRPRRARS